MSTKKDYSVLENFVFTGSDDPSDIKAFYNYIYNHPIPGLETFNPNKSVVAILKEIKEAIYQFGLDLGYDLTPRIKALDRVVFAKKDDLVDKYPEFLKDRTALFSNKNFKIYISITHPNGEFRDYYLIALSLNHEFMHSIAYKEIDFSEKGVFNVDNRGLKRQDLFYVLDEAVTQLTTLDIIRTYWPKFKSLKELVSLAIQRGSNAQVLFLMKPMFKKIAEKKSMSYKDVLTISEKDLLLGTRVIVDLIKEVFGEKVLQDLAEIKPILIDTDLDLLIEKAHLYKLEELEKQLILAKEKNDFSDLIYLMDYS